MVTNRWAELGPIAKTRRKELGLTQQQVTDLGGPQVPVLRALENGQMPHPTYGTLGKSTKPVLERIYKWRPGAIDIFVQGGDIVSDFERVWVPTMRSVDVDGEPFLAMQRGGPVDDAVQAGQIALLIAARDTMVAFEEGHGSLEDLRDAFWRHYNATVTEYAALRGIDVETVPEIGRALLRVIDHATGAVGTDRT
ncbi:hypothetical protein IU500_07200 [Nocardia terpenica]|uniref:hypothetical protein n=1 Tax=Nocardia terpenica TaxID=455432 RepID=UPI0018930070|nr:hypothetical protein [Nocardia terpenica]MBF6060564.1 hypothetical protein [Nocardia terpenica]MBF6103824.1 hypothetical protein [Nocardia terpenica]MBF6111802.1 hypothetical protein [Nocardia terpenica]MBF6118045.1 hypothetical protein [Nocardia terpenica]MBF6155229.1 hypothetical protein [Nocardia terpenica]